MANNKPENTTLKLPKELRDSLAELKFKFHLDELHQVVQLLYNIVDLEDLEELLHSGINAGEQTKEVVEGYTNPETTLDNQFALNVKGVSQ